MNNIHNHYMKYALSLAERGLGEVWPNPSVACILVKDGVVISTARTAKGGRPHAETLALKKAGAFANGATAYITLEPCSHHGKTPPCVDALIKAGIKTAVIACRDVDSRVSGSGIAALQKAGVEVIFGVMEREAEYLNRGFFYSITKRRPLVAIKVAATVDGMVATYGNESKWITGEKAREYGNFLRSKFDAIITGIGTVMYDDPELTCRVPGLENRSPVRVILDSELKLPRDSAIVRTLDKSPVWVFGRARVVDKVFSVKGIEAFGVHEYFEGLDIAEILAKLRDKGITRVMVEAGPRLTTSFIKKNLFDEIYWFKAPKIIGEDGKNAVSYLYTSRLADAVNLKTTEIRSFSEDIMVKLVRD